MTRIGYGQNSKRNPQDRIVSWGKYAGHKMCDVPTDYLEWFATNAYHQMTARKAWVEEELKRRKIL